MLGDRGRYVPVYVSGLKLLTQIGMNKQHLASALITHTWEWNRVSCHREDQMEYGSIFIYVNIRYDINYLMKTSPNLTLPCPQYFFSCLLAFFFHALNLDRKSRPGF